MEGIPGKFEEPIRVNEIYTFVFLFYSLASSGVVNTLRAKVRKILIRADLFLLFAILLLHIIPFRSIINPFIWIDGWMDEA